VEPFSGDLSLELGISVWLRTSGTSLMAARSSLLEIRRVILEVCELDPATEPVPLVGRSPRSDVVNLVGYISELLRRASATTGRGVGTVVEAVVAELPVPADEALGA
jgi:hypothetical protein